jgi:putative RecB family exonuclease
MAAYSASKLSLFHQCARRYFYVHIARADGEPRTQHPATFMGSRVHEAMEHLYAEVARGHVPSLGELVAWFRQAWDVKWQAEPAAVPAGDSAVRWAGIGTECLERYYAAHAPFDAEQTIGLERFVEFPLDSGGTIRFRGFIDRLAKAPDGTIRIHDYKTQQEAASQSEVDADDQLAFYDMAVRHELQHVGPVELVWHFVRAGVVRVSHRTAEQLERVRSEAVRMVQEIEARGQCEACFEPSRSALCRWCEYRRTCPASWVADRVLL